MQSLLMSEIRGLDVAEKVDEAAAKITIPKLLTALEDHRKRRKVHNRYISYIHIYVYIYNMYIYKSVHPSIHTYVLIIRGPTGGEDLNEEGDCSLARRRRGVGQGDL